MNDNKHLDDLEKNEVKIETWKKADKTMNADDSTRSNTGKFDEFVEHFQENKDFVKAKFDGQGRQIDLKHRHKLKKTQQLLQICQ